MWSPPQRNFENIQYELYRKVVDAKFNQLADELSDCYYNFWKHGQSKPFNAGNRTYDVQPNLVESKMLFDKIHGLIWTLHEQAMEDEHEKRPIESRDVKFQRNLDIKMNENKNYVRDRQDKIKTYKQEGIEITR
jgi:hypothetical protein